MELTLEQHKVTQHSDGHALCIAVAGSGKTTTLAYLIKNLLLSGSVARRVMVMMFNKSAQLDFSKKLDHVIDKNQLLPEVRTYHSTGLRLLKSLEKWRLRSPYDHHPMGDKEVELKIRELLLQFAPDTHQTKIKNDTARYVEAAISFINIVKSNLVTPEVGFETSDYPEGFRFFIQIFIEFEQWRHDHRRITFTDMLYDTVCIIEANPEVIPDISNKMNYIIVDEYQDTSTLQHRLTQIIAGERAQVIAVGDPDQTIYEFAGANINNILHHFENDFGATNPVQTLSMPHTFRYGHSIALAASHLISHNRDRKDVLCIAHENNPPSEIKITQSEGDDTAVIIQKLRAHQETSDDSIAILVRVWAQAVPLELSLLTHNVPYHSEGPSLFDRPEIISLISALELAAGQFQLMDPTEKVERFQTLFTVPHLGIKTGLIHELIKGLQGHSENFGKTMANTIEHLPGISDYQRKKLYSRAKAVQFLEAQKTDTPANELLQTYIRLTELKESLQSMSLNDQRTEEQLLAVDGLLVWLKNNGHSVLDSFFQIDQLRQQKRHRKHSKSSAIHQLIISSCHRAKGLEWPIVFIPGLTTKYWPFNRNDELATDSTSDLEAERRLLYVAMTRARKKLHLFTCTGSLTKKQSYWEISSKEEVSRFIRDMELPTAIKISQLLAENNHKSLIDFMTSKGLTPPARKYLRAVQPLLAEAIDSAPSQQSLARSARTLPANSPGYLAARSSILNRKEPENVPWKRDARLRHTIFGKGQVLEVNDSSFVVVFEGSHGVKRFAKTEQILHLFEPL